MASNKDNNHISKNKKKAKKNKGSRIDSEAGKKKNEVGTNIKVEVRAKKKNGKRKNRKKKEKRGKKKRPFIGVTPEMLNGKKVEVKEGGALGTDVKSPLLCPDCGTEIEEGIPNCPECGIALADGEDIVCAVCGSKVSEGLDVCPACGTKFLSSPEATTPSDGPVVDFVHHGRTISKPEVRVGRKPKGPKAPPKGKKRVIKKKVSKGKAPKRPKIKRPKQPKGIFHRPMIVPATIAIFLIIASMIFVLNPASSTIEIDGSFDDWSDVAMHKDDVQTDIPDDVNIVEYGVHTNDDYLFLYLKTKGKLFPAGPTSPSFIEVFIDADGNADTGYLINSIGAESRMDIKGWSSKVQSAKYFTFGSSADASDWTGFVETGNIQVAISESELELSKTLSVLGLSSSSSPAIMFGAVSSDGDVDMSDSPVGLGPGGIVVTQYIKAPSTPVAPGTTGEVFMTITVEARGKGDTFTSMTITRLGSGTPGDVSSISLWSGDMKVDEGKFADAPRSLHQQVHLEPNLPVRVGTPIVLTLKMDIWEKVTSKTVGSMILSTNDLHFKHSPVALYTHQEDALISYINSTPSQPTIDGAWGEWNVGNSVQGGFLGGSSQPNIKLRDIRSDVIKPGYIKLTLEVMGQVLAGMSMPSIEGTVNSSCGPSPRCPNTGQDVIVIYLDSDSNISTGTTVGPVGAEYAVIIQGKYGVVDVANLGFYDYDMGKAIWEKLSSTGVRAFTDNHRIEIELDFSASGLQSMGNDPRYLIELRDSEGESTLSAIIEG